MNTIGFRCLIGCGVLTASAILCAPNVVAQPDNPADCAADPQNPACANATPGGPTAAPAAPAAPQNPSYPGCVPHTGECAVGGYDVMSPTNPSVVTGGGGIGGSNIPGMPGF